MADAPNQLYSWDIIYLPSAIRGQYFYASFEFEVGEFSGSRAGVSPAQRTLEARSPSKMSHG
jgi:hypothetical protein